MQILFTAATPLEWQLLQNNLKTLEENSSSSFIFHVSGVGIAASMFSLTHDLIQHKPDLAVQVGIAGGFPPSGKVGETFIVKDDLFADIGVVEDGEWKDLFDLGFLQPDGIPFTKKKLTNPWLKKYNLLQLPTVSAITVNEITTQKSKLDLYKEIFHPVLESMEGAAFHYACLMLGIPFIQMRTISNAVGDRNKKNWQIPFALDQLEKNMMKYFTLLQQVTN